MPGQKKRKNREQEASRRLARRTAPGTGRWVVHFETRDYVEWRDYVRRLRSGQEEIDLELARIDTLCARDQPTMYRLSLFVPNS